MTWNKRINNFVQVINFQLSSYSNEQEETFTMNLGFFNPNIWETCWRRNSPQFIAEENCFPRIRIGQLLNETKNKKMDHWWTYVRNTDVKKSNNEIFDLLENKCFPFLNKLLSIAAINEFYSTQSIDLLPIEKIYLAIVKNFLGHRTVSEEILNTVRESSNSWMSRVEIVYKQLSTQESR